MDRPAAGEALVTGATGFIGRHLSRRLASDGWRVHAIVRARSDVAGLGEAGVVVLTHDGTMQCMSDIFERIRPSVVFHLASYFVSEHKPEDIPALVDSNIMFGLQLVEAMTANGVCRLVNAGTSWQHYDNAPYNPVNLYAASKQAFEDLLRYYVETRGLKIVTLKLFDTYGPGDQRPKLFSVLRKAAESGQALAMSPGQQLIDIVYIDDVVDAFMAAAARLFSDECGGREEYAVSSGTPVSLRELVGVYQKVTGRKMMITWGGRPYRDREVMVPWTGWKRIKGWVPKISLEKGILLTEMNTASEVQK